MKPEEPYPTILATIRALKASGKNEEAEDEIRRALEKDPDNLELKSSLADLRIREGRLAEGRILAEEVLAGDPQHPQALSVLGDILLKQHAPVEALDCYRQAFSRDPRAYLILKAARALKEMKHFEEALRELEKVLVVHPGNASFLKEKAVILNRMKKLDLALEVFERIKEISSDDPFVQKEILRLRSRAKPETQVLKDLKAVLGMDSKKDDAQMRGLFAQKLKGAGLVKEAAVEYERAFALQPHNLYFLKQQGFCHYREKRYEEAIRCLGEAFRRDPSDVVVRSTLGKIYEAVEGTERFLNLLEEVLSEHPDQRALFGTIRKLRRKLGLPTQKSPSVNSE